MLKMKDKKKKILHNYPSSTHRNSIIRLTTKTNAQKQNKIKTGKNKQKTTEPVTTKSTILVLVLMLLILP